MDYELPITLSASCVSDLSLGNGVQIQSSSPMPGFTIVYTSKVNTPVNLRDLRQGEK
jgi:hypothetical protein